MSFINNIIRLVNQQTSKNKKSPAKRVLPYELKAVSRVRQDIKSWNNALDMANAEEPKNYPLMQLYNEVLIDALLTSQIENRKQQIFSAQFSLLNQSGDKDIDQSKNLASLPLFRKLLNAILDSIYLGYSLIELTNEDDRLDLIEIPRTNIVPKLGHFYTDYSEDSNPVLYRELPQFGTWIMEFDSKELGLLNKAVPHVLFKRFAQSCWSELCEIYGIPPRVMKTNTQDTAMLNRAESMMNDMGAAAWFIIDETESFEFADGVSTNGDVYNNLIKLCNNELSLLISGAIIGQDTLHGSNNKDQSAQNMLWMLVQSDLNLVQQHMNTQVIPALQSFGLIKGELTFSFDPTEDTKQLWNITKDALPYYHLDIDWMKDKFGLEITGDRKSPQPSHSEEGDKKKNKKEEKLQFDNDFFD